MSRAYFDASGRDFAAADRQAIFGALCAALPFDVEQAQRGAWQMQIAHLQGVAAALPDAHIFLEFAIPRMGRRADAVIIAGGLVFVLEYKVGDRDFPRHAIEQVHGYALDLKNFHVTSHDLAIVPLLIATEAPPQQLDFGFWAPDRVHDPLRLSAGDLLPTIRRFLAAGDASPLDALEWANGAYRPTPTIIEAAEALYRGHDVTEISRSGAGDENLPRTAAAIEKVVERMKVEGGKAICFVTGVPGAGKTLAGLNIAAGRLARDVGEDATFLSGNGPLVQVLVAALSRDLRRKHGTPKAGDSDARHRTERAPAKFIQNVHKFRDHYVGTSEIPSEHVVVFDEAQRAWNKQKAGKFMLERGHVNFAVSEPTFLLSVMDRHQDWCVVVCLIGEGQEINEGEAGVSEWVRALQGDFRHWEIHMPSQLLSDGSSLDAGLRWHLTQRVKDPDPGLHLSVSLRSVRSDKVSAFIAALLGEDPATARKELPDPGKFAIYRTRDLALARSWLRQNRRAGERVGIVASSNALRLKPEGLFVKAKVDVCNWFLNPGDDVRSSNALEDAATEFDVQGLELDWVCVAWDLNLRRANHWQPRRFYGAKWQVLSPSTETLGLADYVRNAYRVLLTRARQGMVIFVPRGDAEDATRPPAEYDAIDAWLAACGVPTLDAVGVRPE